MDGKDNRGVEVIDMFVFMPRLKLESGLVPNEEGMGFVLGLILTLVLILVLGVPWRVPKGVIPIDNVLLGMPIPIPGMEVLVPKGLKVDINELSDVVSCGLIFMFIFEFGFMLAKFICCSGLP
ncbi:hypothetical protein RFI_24558 [Reticulomyxa filosa]|uniref:Uncharacterized protein n=1 Tax=Reticulomyxa filosa TaxID=46433 RepID=X6MHB1_RETFI|nr:hypothetical protein RFI_24558 [Reticulomyxa filosa]|eukprot:ETO12817.1 hypothetical protein RFI_24558 [Reticulomyxa filosa]